MSSKIKNIKEVCINCLEYKSFSPISETGSCSDEQSDHYGHVLVGATHPKCITGRINKEVWISPSRHKRDKQGD